MDGESKIPRASLHNPNISVCASNAVSTYAYVDPMILCATLTAVTIAVKTLDPDAYQSLMILCRQLSEHIRDPATASVPLYDIADGMQLVLSRRRDLREKIGMVARTTLDLSRPR